MVDDGQDGQAGLWSEPANQDLDPQLDEVAAVLRKADPDGKRFAGAIRRSIDMLLDGQNTGRYRWDQLHKTEKTHAGTLIEINIQREFDFAGGESMDYAIGGVDVDCKFSQRNGAWMIPPEARDHLLLVVWASDQESRWCAGLVRAKPEHLRIAQNRDGKSTLNTYGKGQIRWLFRDAPLKENMLLRLTEAEINEVFGSSSGQQRVNALFRLAVGKRVSRNVVATVAMQYDYMKRVRGNGGARSFLKSAGIVILGDYAKHVSIARNLNIAEPGEGEFVSARLRPKTAGDLGPSVVLDGEEWVVASPADQITKPAPDLPRV
ncbi:restriction endonuclease [Amycolatopsis rubida]|uniref:Restriction endonuclease n=1 Tax=Amycolatopsis rubida TaxID=112413 RepID=A0ABX0BPD2_9PSEU|nr:MULTISPECIES: NaeI family type II restriction endonuclease [Amycolatopsis]MYW91859.1 restriction endonuclease [Amycolatopsis rubida]NEC56844.1 restriction endonuclease [Amycolatopsis rubida]OAP27987.1 Type-2 restriction enzyme NaeI [Amycolatopsis sp. M39]